MPSRPLSAGVRHLARILLISGWLVACAASAQETTSYTYDALGRLTAASKSGGPSNGQATDITYDPAGNRTNYSIAGGATAPSISISAASANEGSPLSFTATRSGSTAAAASAHWATSNGTAVAGTNYNTASGTVSFAAGSSSATINVTTIHDHLATPNLTVNVTLSTPSGASLGTSTAVGTIVNTDPYATLSVGAASANEGFQLAFPATRSGNTTPAVSAHWATSNGTAVASTNYGAASGTVSFAAGATSATIYVSSFDDHVATSNLTMHLTLSAPSAGASLGTSSAVGTIVNTDSSVMLSVGPASATEGFPLVFTVTRSGSTTSAASVQWATRNGTARAGLNYTAASGTVTVPAGSTTGTFTVYSLDDCVKTTSKVMYVDFSSPSPSGVGLSTTTANGTISNKDTINCN